LAEKPAKKKLSEAVITSLPSKTFDTNSPEYLSIKNNEQRSALVRSLASAITPRNNWPKSPGMKWNQTHNDLSAIRNWLKFNYVQ
jgi:hypothetical protein